MTARESDGSDARSDASRPSQRWERKKEMEVKKKRKRKKMEEGEAETGLSADLLPPTHTRVHNPSWIGGDGNQRERRDRSRKLSRSSTTVSKKGRKPAPPPPPLFLLWGRNIYVMDIEEGIALMRDSEREEGGGEGETQVKRRPSERPNAIPFRRSSALSHCRHH